MLIDLCRIHFDLTLLSIFILNSGIGKTPKMHAYLSLSSSQNPFFVSIIGIIQDHFHNPKLDRSLKIQDLKKQILSFGMSSTYNELMELLKMFNRSTECA